MTNTAYTATIISYDTGQALITQAMAHAKAQGWAIAVAVVDPGGAVVASGRMDRVSPIILDIATDKAFTATLGRSTRDFYDRMSSAPDLAMGLQTRPRLCAWEGGCPIEKDGALIGAIGVSGAAGPEDVACAQAALATL
jgi:uncharacterized protein GlcG (DUF336 family)